MHKKWNNRGITCVIECTATVQVWALSQIPSNPDIFIFQSLFANMDHLYCSVYPHMEDHQFAWIL